MHERRLLEHNRSSYTWKGRPYQIQIENKCRTPYRVVEQGVVIVGGGSQAAHV
jgi:hypothetical protein